MQCVVCSQPALYGCADCRQAFYCSVDCQSEHLDVQGHMAICARGGFENIMRDLWRPVYLELRKLVNKTPGASVRSYDDLVELLLDDDSQKMNNRLVAMTEWENIEGNIKRRDIIKQFELASIDALAEVFRMTLEDSIKPKPVLLDATNRAFILKELLPELLDQLKKVCKESTKFRDVKICPNFSQMRKELKAAVRRPAAEKKALAAQRKQIDLNALWDRKCTGKAPWSGNAFHLMGTGSVIGEFMCKLGLAPMTDKEWDIIVMLLEQLLTLPGKGILQAILPSNIEDMLGRRLRGEKFSITELETLFRKLMSFPGLLNFINSSKGMKSYGLSTAEVKKAPAEQLTRKVDLNDWVSRNCTDKESAICLLQRGYKVGEFLCRLRLIELQSTEFDMIMTIVNGTQAWVDSLRFINPLKAVLNLVLSNGDYANRRLRRAKPPLDELADLESLFSKLKSSRLLGQINSQLTPYGLQSD